MSRVLVLSIYPIAAPRHGGQVRSSELFGRLVRDGWDCRYAAFFNPVPHVAADEPHFWNFPLDPAGIAARNAAGEPEDTHAGEVVLAEPKIVEDFVARVSEFRPRIVVFEQPWLFPLLARIEAAVGRVVCVYSSQNCEATLARGLVASAGMPDPDRLAGRIAALEGAILARCDGLIAVSGEDVALMGATGKPHVVAPNGVRAYSPPDGTAAGDGPPGHWRYALFVASAHPPNAIGLETFFSGGARFLQPGEKIVVIGGVATLLERRGFPADDVVLDPKRFVMLGVQDDATVAAYLADARAVIVPIVSGGGTNLKTAQALVSGKRVIATSFAFRGYEPFMDLSTVTIADEPDAFRAALLEALRSVDAPELTGEERRRLRALTWDRCLADVSDFLGDLLPRGSGSAAHVGDGTARELDLGRVCVFGWHRYEPGSNIWSARNVAIVRLPVTGPSLPARAEFAGHVLMVDKDLPGLVVTMAGREVFRMARRQAFEFTAEIGAGDIDPDGFVELRFEVDRMRSPFERGSGDKRHLGVCLRTVRLAAGTPPSA